ncbi:Hypothetical predicted protein [Mytilus galloprovincialis]|uniref:Uncharacterized protein n=1 Tax=Mytilus galloprovincialis TaxID=29158 RepID=A0A8B6G039_MYTGA|nr:Hypothetical predicted protein [Mytilus galloprovincialis]
MGIHNKDEFISKDFPSTMSKDSRITKSLSADLSTTEVQMSTQLVQTSFDYTPSLHYETGGHISSTAWSSNNHLLLHSDILSNDVTYKCVSPKCTPSKQLNHDSTFNQEKISSTFIFDHGIIDVFTSSINSFSASPKLAFTTSASSFVINDRYYSKLSMFNNSQHSKHSLGSVLLQSSSTYPVSSASSSIMNDYEASKFSMTTISSHSKQYHSSVIVHSSAYELKTSVQTISPSSQKIATNHVNRISTLIVPVSSPHQTTVYSSSLKATKAATLPPKMVITTSFIVLPRRTTSTVSPMISTSNIDLTTGMNYLYYTVNTIGSILVGNWMKDNMLLVLGISIGVAVVLVVVVIILIVRRKKSNKPPPRPELDPSDLFSNRRVTLLLGPDDELMPDMQPAYNVTVVQLVL